MNDKLEITVDAKTIYDSLKKLESQGEEMIAHQKKTNGRVTKCEDEIQSIKDFKN